MSMSKKFSWRRSKQCWDYLDILYMPWCLKLVSIVDHLQPQNQSLRRFRFIWPPVSRHKVQLSCIFYPHRWCFVINCVYIHEHRWSITNVLGFEPRKECGCLRFCWTRGVTGDEPLRSFAKCSVGKEDGSEEIAEESRGWSSLPHEQRSIHLTKKYGESRRCVGASF